MMKLRLILLYSLLMAEGAIVIFMELIGAHVLVPIFGFSAKIPGVVLGISLLALALGYYSSSYLKKKVTLLLLILILAGIAISLLVNMNYGFITKNIVFGTGSLFLPAFIIIFPVTFLCGLLSPLLISEYISTAGIAIDSSAFSAKAYAISTIGGFFSAIISGFFLIPIIGIRESNFILALLITIVSFVYFVFSYKLNKLKI